MTFNDLPIDVQERLNSERAALASKKVNTSYDIKVYNEAGTRYFTAHRMQQAYLQNGCYMPYGGGSIWSIRYGKVTIIPERDPMGGTRYRIGHGANFRKSLNGTIIPNTLATKADVLNLIAQIGIFSL